MRDETAASAASAAEETAPSRLEREQLAATLKEWVRADIDHWNDWRTRAREEFAFVAGPGQWKQEEITLLKEQMRPVVTFNKTLKFVRAICGVEKNNRQAINYLPTDVTAEQEVVANEMLTAASDWMGEQCKAPRHQSRAVRDAVICGMGWTEAIVDFDDDPKGRYVETRCDPLEMGWDKDARDDNLQDAKRIWRARRMKLQDAKAIVGGVADISALRDSDFDASWTSDLGKSATEVKTQEQKELREESRAVTADSDVTLVHIQWIEREVYIKAQDPMSGQLIDLTQEQFNAVQQQMGPIPHARLRRKVYRQAFLGNELLHVGPAPCQSEFTWSCITWEPDDSDGSWFGIVRVLRDPQSWSNKFFSQLMHMVNSTAKGGIIAEADAFEDVEEAKRNYARPDAVTLVKPGAIQKGKLMPKPGAAITGGVMSLMEITDSMFPEVTGINLELMGLADREQAGVLEAQRKQAAMTILADLFDSISSFRENVGRLRLHYIQKYFADGRIIRIYGESGMKAVPLIRDAVAGQYDVTIDDAPTSTNMKEKAWAGLTMLLPAVQHMLTPKVVTLLLDYVPYLPAKLVQSLKAMSAEPDPQAAEQAEIAKRGAQAQIAKDEAAAQKSKAGAILDLAKAGAEQAQAEESRWASMLAMLGMGGAPRSKYKPAADEIVMGQPPMAPRQPSMAPIGEALDIAAPAPQQTNGIGATNGVLPPGGLR